VRQYETAVAHPDGTSTVERLAATATRHGYAGLVVTNAGETGAFDAAGLRERHGIDVVDGVAVAAPDVETAAGRLENVRSGSETRYTVVAVAAGSPDVARFAAERDRVDALLLPAYRDVEFDHVVAAAAEEHAVRVALTLDGALRASGEERERALRLLRRRREILDDAGARPLVTADARSHLGLRAPRELAAVGETVGLSGERVHEGLAGWGAVVDRIRERTGSEFVEPGVWRGRAGGREGDDGPGAGDPTDAEGERE
jgi:ribonuclease P/MRP protein subunit RPP1